MPYTRAAVDTEAYIRFMKRVVRAAGTRFADADVEDLVELIEIRRDLDEAIAAAVNGLRDNGGASWADIAAATGTSRQAAWEKWGKSSPRGDRLDAD